MPEVVQPDRREAGLEAESREQLADGRRVDRAPVFPGEDVTRLLPRLTPREPLLVLPGLARPQDLHGALVEHDRGVAGLRLGVAFLELPAELHDLLGHGVKPGVQVEVNPPDSARLAAAQASERDEMKLRIQPVLGGDVEEHAELRRRPHHDRARPRRRLPDTEDVHRLPAGSRPGLFEAPLVLGRPGGHAGLGPRQGLRPLPGLQLHQLGDVVRHRTLALGVAQRGAERGPDPLLGRRTGDALPLHRRSHGWVLRGAGLEDGLVLRVDLGEHLLDMRHAQPVEPVGVEYMQVDAVVRLVGEQRGLADIASPPPPCDPPRPELAERLGVERLAGLVLAAQLVVVR
nr:hypothetical protein [Sphaerisporangium perillae]